MGDTDGVNGKGVGDTDGVKGKGDGWHRQW